MNLPFARLGCLMGLFAGLGLGLFAEETPGPTFDLIGSVSEKAVLAAPSWESSPQVGWTLVTDLKPRFTAGPVSFRADSAWTLPLSASLTPSSVGISVPEAYFRISPWSGLDLTLGQKRFSLGVGQTFTVGDSINPAIGFFDQKTGFRGVTGEWSPVSWASVSGAATADRGTADSPVTFAGQGSLLVDQLQVTVSAVGRKDVTFNPAVGLSYDVFGVIVTAEGAAEFLPQGLRPSGPALGWKAPSPWTEPALSGSFGARWTPTIGDWDLTLSAEALHWGQGWTNEETDAWKAALSTPGAGLARGVRSALPLRSRENAFFRVGVSTGGVFSVSTFAAVDLQDQSALGQVSAVWTPWDDLDLSTSIQGVSGQAGTSWEFLNQARDRYQTTLQATYHF